MVCKLKFYCHTLLKNFLVKTGTFQTFTLLYLTLLVYRQLWFRIKMFQPKREGAGFLSKYERLKLQRLYTQGCGTFGSVRNSVKTSNLPKSKVRQFSISKRSYTEATLATRKFKRRKVFVRFKIEIWCMDLAYFDKLA